MSDAQRLEERITALLEKSGLSDGLEYDGTGVVFDGRAHVAYVSNHQSGQRGTYVAQFIAAAPRLLREAVDALTQLRAERDELSEHLKDAMASRQGWKTLAENMTPAELEAERKRHT